MKEHEVKLTLQETEQLCRLYMDCELTVLEETELQYVLGKLPYSSPCIDEVRTLMGLTIPPAAIMKKKKTFDFLKNRTIVSIAASFSVLLAVGVALLSNQRFDGSSASNDDTNVYIAAYSHGECLYGTEAVASTNIAMAKADSLMKYASLTEHEYMMKAGEIISKTTNN